MNNNRPIESTTGISLGDIYFVLFRNKWKIIIFSVLGIVAAIGVYYFRPPPYQSQAELLIKYVPESQMTLLESDQRMIVPGNDIITSELQILTSLDLAEEAVTNIGASNVLAGVHVPVNSVNAAAYLRSHLTAAPADRGSSVIVVTFTHPNPQIVQPVLQEIIGDYFLKHYEIHSAGSQLLDNLTMEQSALNVQLNATEQQLADLKNKANIISLDDSRKDLSDQIAKIRGDVLDAQVELSGYEATIKQAGSNQLFQIDLTNAQEVVPPEQMDAYNTVCVTLDTLQKKAENYLAEGFTKSNSLLLEVNRQIADTEITKSDLEKKYPQIVSPVAAGSSTGSEAAPVVDPRTTIAQLQAKIKVWSTQLDALQTQATNLNNLAPTIAQLEQAKAIQQANVQNLSESIERSHIDSALDTGKTPNIRWIQTPSPPGRDWTKTNKLMEMLAFGGIGLGLAWAFLLEFYLDGSVKRPVEIETKLRLPLFLSIPDFSRNGHSGISPGKNRRLLPLESETTKHNASSEAGVVSPNSQVIVLPEKNRIIEPYHEALRDRLIAYFELKGLTHKPKLVAVTSANHGAGVSSLAAGLAASFSVTGDGNVLLVDMNLENGAAQQFYKGKSVCGLDTALQSETKNDALVQENLYVVAGNSKNDNLPRVLPKRFAGLVPKFKASDFDYIIFDMPPVSQTSVTSRVARFMDMVLLVIESEKTDRDIVRRVKEQLTEFGGTVGAVLNKTHQYIPERLYKELPGHK